MSRPIEQALNNLIPRHPGSLPPELIELASSLLAQSRSKISNLRAEEEIGRTYACANLACERYITSPSLSYSTLLITNHSLKTTLNLPSIESRPPCPPKIYKKLYGHFDQILISTSRKRTKSSTNNPSTPSKPLPQKQTPVKGQSLEGFRGHRTPKRGLRYGSNKEKEKLPKWVGPAIRKICKEFDAGKAVPHVWAGVESVLYLPCPKDGEGGADMEDGPKMKGKMPALIIAVWFFVMTRLAGKETNGKEYVKRRKKILEILLGMREDEAVVAKVGEEDKDWEKWECVTAKDVDHWLSDIVVREWNALDWYTNIEEGSGVSGTIEGEQDEATDDEEDKEAIQRASKRMRRAGLGTMMQPKFDYLSDEKRDEYAVWKVAMLEKIDGLVVEGIIDDMDTAEG